MGATGSDSSPGSDALNDSDSITHMEATLSATALQPEVDLEQNYHRAFADVGISMHAKSTEQCGLLVRLLFIDCSPPSTSHRSSDSKIQLEPNRPSEAEIEQSRCLLLQKKLAAWTWALA